MPANREMTMRQMRQVLRLHASQTSDREIGRIVGAARSTVRDAIQRAKAAGLIWPLPDDLTDAALEERLFARAGARVGTRRRPEPDWAHLVQELKRPGVSIAILHEEYWADHPDGYGYSRFCDLVRSFERRLTPTMRQHHVAGDKVFVDYSGKKLPIVDPLTGEIRHAEIFVAVLGASNLTYAEATWTQTLPDWIEAHVRLFRFFGGVPKLGHRACREDLSVLSHRVPRLFAALDLARSDGRYARLLRSLARAKLLILDDWGPEALTGEQQRDLLEIVEDRYDAGSLLITSQVPVENWYAMIGSIPTLADAILDRVVHNAYRITLTGESLRKTRHTQAGA